MIIDYNVFATTCLDSYFHFIKKYFGELLSVNCITHSPKVISIAKAQLFYSIVYNNVKV